jgi:hypothetical protein
MASVAEICQNALTLVGDRQVFSSFGGQTLEEQLLNQRWGMALDTLAEEYDWHFATKRTIMNLVAAPYPAWSAVTTYPQSANVTLAGTTGFFTSLSNGNLNNAPNVNGTAFWSYTPYYTRTGWLYMYQAPADMLDVQEVQFQPDYGINGPYIDNPPYPPPSQLRQPLSDQKADWKVEGDDALDGGRIILCNFFPGTAELKYTANLRQLGAFPAHFSEPLMYLLAHSLAMGLPNKRDYAADAWKMYQHRLMWAIARDINKGERETEQVSAFEAVRGGGTPLGGGGSP